MDSQEIIRALAKKFKVSPAYVTKLNNGKEIYQIATQRYLVMSNDDLIINAIENLPNTINDIYNSIGRKEFIKYSLAPIKTDAQFRILDNLVSYGKDASVFLIGIIKSPEGFVNNAAYNYGWARLMSAEEHYEITSEDRTRHYAAFVLDGSYPLVEEGEPASPEPAPGMNRENLNIMMGRTRLGSVTIGRAAPLLPDIVLDEVEDIDIPF